MLEKNLEIGVTHLQKEKENKIAVFTQIIAWKYDELQKKMTGQWTEENKRIVHDLEVVDTILDQIDDTAKNVDPDDITLEDVSDKLKGVSEVSTHVNLHMAGTRNSNHLDYKDHQVTSLEVESLCGRLIQNETIIEITKPSTLEEVKFASGLKYSGKRV